MNYDLGDCTCWEFMFPNNDKPILQVPDEDEIMFNDDEQVEISTTIFDLIYELIFVMRIYL